MTDEELIARLRKRGGRISTALVWVNESDLYGHAFPFSALEPVAAPDFTPTLGICTCGLTGPCMWDQCKHPLAKGAADDRA